MPNMQSAIIVFNLAFGMAMQSGVAWADVTCTLEEVAGKKGPPALDARLERHRKLLESPPLRDYPAFTLVASHGLTFNPEASGTTGKTSSGQLASGQKYLVTFLARLVEREGRGRLRLQLEISGADGKPSLRTIFVVTAGGPSFSRVEQKGDAVTLQLVTCQAG